jgi:hypothetical protein
LSSCAGLEYLVTCGNNTVDKDLNIVVHWKSLRPPDFCFLWLCNTSS